jgi:hypothetical protein
MAVCAFRLSNFVWNSEVGHMACGVYDLTVSILCPTFQMLSSETSDGFVTELTAI